ncbi:MAG: hypothetical protein HY082_01835 [Gammaproteobacteria bacterium]|nr:hypothetical protein [Gammaproteobacteria bacterium]
MDAGGRAASGTTAEQLPGDHLFNGKMNERSEQGFSSYGRTNERCEQGFINRVWGGIVRISAMPEF